MLALTVCVLDEEISDFNVIEFKSHILFAVYNKLKQQYVKNLELFVKCNSVNAKTFQFKIKPAMRSYKIDCTVDWRFYFLHWYKQCSFRFESTSKKYTIHIRDHIQLGFDKFALIKKIYTYQLLFNKNKTKYVFFSIKHFKIALYRDKVLQLNISMKLGPIKSYF